MFVSGLLNLFLEIIFLEYKDVNFIPIYLEKICLFNICNILSQLFFFDKIFSVTLKIGRLIDSYMLIYFHLHKNFILTVFFRKFFLFSRTFYDRK